MIRRRRRLVVLQEPNAQDEAFVHVETLAPRRHGRRPRTAQAKEQPPPQPQMAHDLVDPIANGILGLQQTVSILGQSVANSL